MCAVFITSVSLQIVPVIRREDVVGVRRIGCLHPLARRGERIAAVACGDREVEPVEYRPAPEAVQSHRLYSVRKYAQAEVVRVFVRAEDAEVEDAEEASEPSVGDASQGSMSAGSALAEGEDGAFGGDGGLSGEEPAASEAENEGMTAAQLRLATKKSLASASVGERARNRWKRVNKTAKLQVTIARSIMSEVRSCARRRMCLCVCECVCIRLCTGDV